MKPWAASRELYIAHATRSKAHLALHGKAAVFDRKTVFVGSFNLDPRSAALDTETVFVVHSPELAEQFLRGVRHRFRARQRLADRQGRRQAQGRLDHRAAGAHRRRASRSGQRLAPLRPVDRERLAHPQPALSCSGLGHAVFERVTRRLRAALRLVALAAVLAHHRRRRVPGLAGGLAADGRGPGLGRARAHRHGRRAAGAHALDGQDDRQPVPHHPPREGRPPRCARPAGRARRRDIGPLLAVPPHPPSPGRGDRRRAAGDRARALAAGDAARSVAGSAAAARAQADDHGRILPLAAATPCTACRRTRRFGDRLRTVGASRPT